MPKMKNVSERKFTIAGKDLKQGEVGEFAQSVIEQHIAAYPLELVAVVEEGDKSIQVKTEEVKEVLPDAPEPESDTEKDPPEPEADEPQKKRGRKPKNA